VIVIDKLLVSGLKFVLQRIVDAVDAEMNDESLLREELLSAQMRHELGEIDDEELDAIERAVLKRMREIREARGESAAPASAGRYKFTGADILLDEPERPHEDSKE
jgi:hypothetical protein